MLRRELLKALPALALVPTVSRDGKVNTDSVGSHIDPGYYMVFVAADSINLENIAQMQLPVPDVEMEFIPVYLRHGQTIHDVVALYRVDPGQSLPTPEKDVNFIQVVNDNTEEARTILGLKKS